LIGRVREEIYFVLGDIFELPINSIRFERFNGETRSFQTTDFNAREVVKYIFRSIIFILFLACYMNFNSKKYDREFDFAQLTENIANY